MSMSGSLSPRETFTVRGHEAAVQLFLDALASGRLHHAWLLHGPAGIGKATLAFHLARVLLKATDSGSPAGRRVTAGTHADLMVIGRGVDERKGRLRPEIVADDVRPIQSFLHRTAAEGGWRVVIVDGAEFMNRHAANGLLKLLEEPPAQVAFFLVTASPGGLLPTIRSRCRGLALQPLADVDMRAVLQTMGYDAQDMPRLLATAHGAPGRAAFLALDRDGAIQRQVAEWLGRDAPRVTVEQAEAIARQDDGFALLCDLLGDAMTRRAREMALGDRTTEAARMAAGYAALSALRRETGRFNLDKTQAVLQAAAIVSEL
ncbi:DNA polymerase III subunit delta' [Acetobacteraceae bacterium LMG 32668]|uniref:DNA polymerase III subunit delta n=2 Tax=Brytella acorum TaxID=2959299 RepID=A0AA35VA05_9PROT|nr:DNA polymerase III subunit delta' [Brytella acorum]MDF3624480.1 DNA polymerase III subunit delta' [Brytella acorum]CAI9119670.1 DNA polymerase III subunit delta' [Brytella acorum]